MNGWLRLWRVWGDAAVSRDANAWLVMTHLLVSARWARTQNRTFGYWLEPGQTDLTTPQLMDRTGLTEKQVRGALNRLCDRYHSIRWDTIRGAHPGRGQGRAIRIITFERWELYQPPGAAQGGATEDQQGGAQGTERAAEGRAKGRSIRTEDGQETSVNPGEDSDPLNFD